MIKYLNPFKLEPKKLFIFTSVLMFIPTIWTISYIKNSTLCNFFNDYLNCVSNNLLLDRILNATYITLIGLLLSVSYYLILKNKTVFSIKEISVIIMLFLLTLPFGTTDIFYYRSVAHGETESINPFKGGFTKEIKIINFKDAPSDKPVMYPPLLLKISSFIYSIAPNNELISIYLYKLFAALAFIVTGFLILKFFGVDKFTSFITNPLLLFEFITNAHFDVYLILLIVLSIILIKSNQAIKSIYVLFLMALIKFNGILVAPIYASYLFLNNKLKLKAFFQILIGTVLGILTFIILYKEYWFGIDTIKGIIDQSAWSYNSLFERLTYSKLNPYKHIMGGTIVGQSFRDNYIYLNVLGLSLLLIHFIKNLHINKKIKANFKLAKITLNASIFYSGLVLLVFPTLCLRYFLPWYLSWSIIYFILSDFTFKNKLLITLNLIIPIYYGFISYMMHFNLNITTESPYNYSVAGQFLVIGIVYYFLFKTKIKILDYENTR